MKCISTKAWNAIPVSDSTDTNEQPKNIPIEPQIRWRSTKVVSEERALSQVLVNNSRTATAVTTELQLNPMYGWLEERIDDDHEDDHDDDDVMIRRRGTKMFIVFFPRTHISQLPFFLPQLESMWPHSATNRVTIKEPSMSEAATDEARQRAAADSDRFQARPNKTLDKTTWRRRLSKVLLLLLVLLVPLAVVSTFKCRSCGHLPPGHHSRDNPDNSHRDTNPRISRIQLPN